MAARRQHTQIAGLIAIEVGGTLQHARLFIGIAIVEFRVAGASTDALPSHIIRVFSSGTLQNASPHWVRQLPIVAKTHVASCHAGPREGVGEGVHCADRHAFPSAVKLYLSVIVGELRTYSNAFVGGVIGILLGGLGTELHAFTSAIISVVVGRTAEETSLIAVESEVLGTVAAGLGAQLSEGFSVVPERTGSHTRAVDRVVELQRGDSRASCHT